MADILSAKARQPIARPVLASLASLGADGSPQVTPLWLDLDGDDLLFHTAQGRVKARHIERDPRVAVSVIDPDDPYNVVALRGTVTDITTEGGDAHIDALAEKYLGVDSYPMRTEGEVRIKVRVRTDHIAIRPESSTPGPRAAEDPVVLRRGGRARDRRR
jgi:PPOX class probable F420-dependent enzyme